MIGEELRAEIEKPARRKGVAPIQQMLALVASLALIWFVFRTGSEDAKPVADGAPSPRVASTSPAITDSLVELGLSARLPTLSPEEALALLAGNGNLIKRPVLLGPGVALAGFQPEAWRAALSR